MMHDSVGRPEVSIIIAAYNEGVWLQKTIQTIKMAQVTCPYESLIIDDGSTDKSVQLVKNEPPVRIISSGQDRHGAIAARNLGVKAAAGKYLCFLDGHVLVHDRWLDYLRETCNQFATRALVSGNLPDVDYDVDITELETPQYGYTLNNLQMETGWYFYGNPYTDRPYCQPLTSSRLMFVRLEYFHALGGFESALRQQGTEDIALSLRNYYNGGSNIVDPRVVVRHYYKDCGVRQASYAVSEKIRAFNRLYVAATYMSDQWFGKVEKGLVRRARDLAEELEIDAIRRNQENNRGHWQRSFDDWLFEFKKELHGFVGDQAVWREPART